MGGESNVITFDAHSAAAGANINYTTPKISNSCFFLRNALFQVVGAGGDLPTISIYAVVGDVSFLIASAAGVRTYVLPNTGIPSPVALEHNVRIQVITAGMALDTAHVYLSFTELNK